MWSCLLSGGNIDVTILSRVITRGLLKSGRSADIIIELSDKPGQLSGVSKIVADLGGNVVAVNHDRADLDMDINACFLRLVLKPGITPMWRKSKGSDCCRIQTGVPVLTGPFTDLGSST